MLHEHVAAGAATATRAREVPELPIEARHRPLPRNSPTRYPSSCRAFRVYARGSPQSGSAFADELAAQVDGLDRGEGTDIGEGVGVDDDEIGVVAAA